MHYHKLLNLLVILNLVFSPFLVGLGGNQPVQALSLPVEDEYASPPNTIPPYRTPSHQINTAPVLDNSGDPYLDAILQDTTNPTGTLVSTMLARGANNDPITDPDLLAEDGIAVIGVDDSGGTWQYSTDGGQTWLDFDVASTAPEESDLALSKTVSTIDADVGDFLTYTLTITNQGQGNVTNTVLTDTLPSNVTFMSALM